MKTNQFLQTLVLLFFVFTAHAQQGINYKAIVKDGQGYAIANTAVTVQFTILENGTTPVYQETHNPTTDANGIVIVNIGEGTVVSGVFNDINWGDYPHFLKTEIDTGGGLTDMGTTEFKTVPYALHALNSSGGVTEMNDLSDVQTYDFIKSLSIGQGAGLGGLSNTVIGYEANYSATTGGSNTVLGNRAHYTGGGSQNTAIGVSTLYSNRGLSNTAVGNNALYNNTTGESNTAVGNRALSDNIDGNYNVAIGYEALTGIASGGNNIAIGYQANVPDPNKSNQIQIGNNSIKWAGCHVPWSLSSDKRWKKDIRNLPYGLDMLMQLKPVDYIRKNNSINTREMGFIAQDFEKVLNEMGYNDLGLLTKDDDGYLHLRYNDFIALLTKGIQEQQAIINNLMEKLEDQEKDIEGLKAEMAQLSSLINQILASEENHIVAEK